jgi:hypothetical protein
VVLAFGHALRAHEALGCPDALCSASLRLSIASSRMVSSSAMNEVYGRAAAVPRRFTRYRVVESKAGRATPRDIPVLAYARASSNTASSTIA